MRNPKHTEENIRKLAEECVEFWDMDCLVDFAVSRLISDYKGDKELFFRDWKDIMRTGRSI